MLSVLDIFRVGVGPSSSHTVGPMRISARFIRRLTRRKIRPVRIQIIVRGSLALTGKGHGTPRAACLGLLGYKPETIDIIEADTALARLNREHKLSLPLAETRFAPAADFISDYNQPADLHPNEMEMRALDASGAVIDSRIYYSTGGGFIASAAQLRKPPTKDKVPSGSQVPYEFGSARELLAHCAQHGVPISDIILANEDTKRARKLTCARLDAIADTMDACIDRGLATEGILPGGLEVSRRAPGLWAKLKANPWANEREQLFDLLNVFAMAVNEENAAGGKVVTAPTNGAAGIIPALLRHYISDPEHKQNFLLTAGGIGLLYKQRASISGAEMGCQGEVGVACSMGAGGLAAIWGGTPEQVASAAEIGMEHNLGLTCDPVGGLVQIPCIERNAIGAVKAANAARLALHAPSQMKVSLDQVIETMRQTGLDMSSKYKETSQGGLAVNVVEC